jgi:hypothetical protein
MSTLNEREAVLRRVLHGAAETVEPRFDGLERIQARLGRPHPIAVAWAEAAWTDLRLRAQPMLQSGLEWLASAIRLAYERFGPTPERSGGRAARTLGWVRPLAALGVTVAIVAAGAYAALDAQQAIFPSSSNSLHSTGGSGKGAGSHGGSGTGSTQSNGAVGQAGSPSGTSASPNCTPGAKPSSTPASTLPSISPIQSPSVTPSPSASTGESPSPSPSASDSSSPGPALGVTDPAANSTSGSIEQASMSATGGSVIGSAALQRASPKASPSPCAKKKKRTTRNPSPLQVQRNVNTQPTTQAVGLAKLNDRA